VQDDKGHVELRWRHSLCPAQLIEATLLKNLLVIEMISCIALFGFYFVLTTKARSRLGTGPIVLALGMPAVGFLMPWVWLTYIACIASIPILARNRRQIAPLYVLSLFILPDLAVPDALGALKLSSIKTSTCFGIGAFIAAVWRGGFNAKTSKFDVPFAVLFAVLIFISGRETSVTNVLREIVDHFIQYAIPYLVISRLVKTPDDFRALAVALGCGGVLLASFLLFEFLFNWPLYRAMYDNAGLNLGSASGVKLREGSIRATGPFIEATAAAFCLTFAVFAASQIRAAFSSRLFHYGVVGLLILGVFPPQSRGALLGLAAGFGAIYLYRRSQTVIAVLLVLVGFLAVFFATVGLEPQSTTASSTDTAATIEYRKRLMSRGMEEFSARPLTGDSYPRVLERMEDLRQGEGIVDFVNTYLWVALLGGLIGLIPFAAAFAARFVSLWQIRARLKRVGFTASPAAFAFASLVAPAAMLAFTSFGGRIAIMTFIALGLSTALISATRRGRVKAGTAVVLGPAIETPLPSGARSSEIG
jgi:O-antigen ligase